MKRVSRKKSSVRTTMIHTGSDRCTIKTVVVMRPKVSTPTDTIER